MNIYMVGDLQLHAWSGQSVTPDGIDLRLKDVLKQLRRIRKQAAHDDVSHVFILGDIFEERGRLDIVVLNEFYRELKKFKKAGITVYLLLGNHDRVDVGDYHSLEVLERVAVILDKPQIIEIGEDQTHSVSILAIPFQSERKVVKKWLKKHGKEVDGIIMHVFVDKFDGIRLKHIPKGPFVFMGHDHTPAKLRKRVYVVGSLLQVNKGEEGQTKRYFLWNTYKKKIKPQIVNGPEFISIDISSLDDLSGLDPELIRGNFVTYCWKGDVVWPKLGEVETALMEMGARSVEASTVLLELITADADNELSTVKLHEVLQDQVRLAQVKDRGPLLDMGKRILSEAADEENSS